MKIDRLAAFVIILLIIAVPAYSGDWHEEFDDLCSKVEIADNMSIEEVQALIDRADKLMPIIKKSEDPKKKVYIFRLKKCRSFFEFSIKSRQ